MHEELLEELLPGNDVERGVVLKVLGYCDLGGGRVFRHKALVQLAGHTNASALESDHQTHHKVSNYKHMPSHKGQSPHRAVGLDVLDKESFRSLVLRDEEELEEVKPSDLLPN